nr:MAG TPA: hypothetical protein [Caudoviricetes sp.]
MMSTFSDNFKLSDDKKLKNYLYAYHYIYFKGGFHDEYF